MEGVHINWLAIVVATLMPMLIGFIYYHPKVMGGIWMRANGFTPESVGNGPKPINYVVAMVLSFALAFWCRMQFMDVHQTSLNFDDTPKDWVTFRHGVAHGLFYGLMVILPVFGTNAIFERRSLSYVLVNVGYWTLTLMAVCAIVCGWR
ncbi:MAG TPA: DUF1761 domain-containing protein [Saprospiraceae bacterium]|nr:DUF1761 domain-containing protein [Saprospiraceae bacterium]